MKATGVNNIRFNGAQSNRLEWRMYIYVQVKVLNFLLSIITIVSFIPPPKKKNK